MVEFSNVFLTETRISKRTNTQTISRSSATLPPIKLPKTTVYSTRNSQASPTVIPVIKKMMMQARSTPNL